MGQTVSSVRVGQDPRSLIREGAGVKPAGFHPLSFLSFLYRTHRSSDAKKHSSFSQVLFRPVCCSLSLQICKQNYLSNVSPKKKDKKK